jgi:hypothetical protein
MEIKNLGIFHRTSFHHSRGILGLHKATRLPAMTLALLFSLIFSLILSLAFFPTKTEAATFLTRDLQVGSRGSDVSALQLFLAEDPSIYPQAMMTGYFGSLTRAAVVRFQARYGIPQVGRVGPQTRAKINSLGSLGGGSMSSTNSSTLAPVMSGVAVSTVSTGTTVYWTTNELARTKLFFNTSPLTMAEAGANFVEPAVSGQVVSNPNFGMSHSYSLNTGSLMMASTTSGTSTTTASGIPAGTTFYFMAMSIDQQGNVSMSPMGSFRTQ